MYYGFAQLVSNNFGVCASKIIVLLFFLKSKNMEVYPFTVYFPSHANKSTILLTNCTTALNCNTSQFELIN